MSMFDQWKKETSTAKWHCWNPGESHPADPPMCVQSIAAVTADVLGAAVTLQQCCEGCKGANEMPES